MDQNRQQAGADSANQAVCNFAPSTVNPASVIFVLNQIHDIQASNRIADYHAKRRDIRRESVKRRAYAVARTEVERRLPMAEVLDQFGPPPVSKEVARKKQFLRNIGIQKKPVTLAKLNLPE